MDFTNFQGFVDERESQLEASRTMPLLMRKVFTWMAMALVITGVVAYGVASSPGLLQTVFTGYTPLVLFVVEIGLVVFLSARLHKLSLLSATLCFVAFSALNGLTLSAIFLVYTFASITQTFFVCAATFGAMAVLGYTTKKDLSKMGGILFMAIIGLIIAGVVNMFLRSSMFELIISGLGVLIFTGITAWDVNTIKRQLLQLPDASNETVQKVALIGALNLYLDFINLFLYLLRFLGNRNN